MIMRQLVYPQVAISLHIDLLRICGHYFDQLICDYTNSLSYIQIKPFEIS